MKIWRHLTVPVIVCSIFWACQKPGAIPTGIESSIASIKLSLDSIKYQHLLESKIHDSIRLYWEPRWGVIKRLQCGDTLNLYIPLTPKAVNLRTGQAIKIKVLNISKFLLVRQYGTKWDYYLENFVGLKDSGNLPGDLNADFSDFSGNLTLYDLVARKEYYYKYLNGKPIKINFSEEISVKKSQGNISSSCTYIEVCSWTRACTEGLTVTVTESPASERAYAYPCPPPTNVPGCGMGGWTKSHSYLKIDCSQSQLPPPPTPPGPIGGGPGGGTGSEGESSETPVPKDTNVAKIALYCSNFGKSTREKFNTSFYNLVTDAQRGCFYNYILTSLEDPSKNWKFNICIGGDPNTNGQYNPNNRTLYFPNDFLVTIPGTLGHELFHIYQDKFYPGGIAQYNTGASRTGYPNIEFEQALFLDLISKGNIPQAISRGTSEQRNAYQNWLNTITNNWTTFPKNYSELGGQYFQFMEMFKNLYPEYNYAIDTNLLPLAMLSAFSGTACPMP